MFNSTIAKSSAVMTSALLSFSFLTTLVALSSTIAVMMMK